jgi:hypothetical protein
VNAKLAALEALAAHPSAAPGERANAAAAAARLRAAASAYEPPVPAWVNKLQSADAAAAAPGVPDWVAVARAIGEEPSTSRPRPGGNRAPREGRGSGPPTTGGGAMGDALRSGPVLVWLLGAGIPGRAASPLGKPSGGVRVDFERGGRDGGRQSAPGVRLTASAAAGERRREWRYLAQGRRRSRDGAHGFRSVGNRSAACVVSTSRDGEFPRVRTVVVGGSAAARCELAPVA